MAERSEWCSPTHTPKMMPRKEVQRPPGRTTKAVYRAILLVVIALSFAINWIDYGETIACGTMVLGFRCDQIYVSLSLLNHVHLFIAVMVATTGTIILVGASVQMLLLVLIVSYLNEVLCSLVTYFLMLSVIIMSFVYAIIYIPNVVLRTDASYCSTSTHLVSLTIGETIELQPMTLASNKAEPRTTSPR